jgi:predicted acylesterase/phospholipase RssA
MSAVKQAVVLSGGGANGAYEVGVLKALLAGKSPATGHSPLAPDIFAGTSIGSFNAAFLASQWDTYGAAAAGNLESVWLDRLAQNDQGANGAFRFRGDPFEFLEPTRYVPNPFQPFLQLVEDTAYLAWDGLQRTVHFATNRDESLRQRLAELPNFTSFVSTAPWERTIQDTIRFESLRSSSRQLRIAATNWTTGELRVFGNLDMTDRLGPRMIMASSAVPGIFPVIYIGAEPHVDGGVLMNTPLKLATDLGADVLHVIYLDPAVRAIPLDALQSTIGTVYRQQTIAWANVVNDDIEDAAVINRSIEIVDLIERGEEIGDPDVEIMAKSLTKILSRVRKFLRYRPLTIHRYHPRDDLSGGALGLLNLERPHVEQMIQRGFNDAVLHDCVAEGCVLPKADAGGVVQVGEKHPSDLEERRSQFAATQEPTPLERNQP